MVQIGDKNILDRKFLEFWGNLFLNIAKGQEQIENLSSLMNMDSITNMDFMNFQNMAKLFKQSYGLPLDDSDGEKRNRLDLDKKGYKLEKIDQTAAAKMRESLESFQSSFSKYITIWGFVTKTEYEELKKSYDILKSDYDNINIKYNNLQKSYETLKQKAEVQEELISQLRDILNSKGIGHIELFQYIQNIARKQTNEFQNLIQNILKTSKDE